MYGFNMYGKIFLFRKEEGYSSSYSPDF